MAANSRAISLSKVRRLPLWQPLAERDFRLLLFGQSVSRFGDYFYFVALPLFTLKLTGSEIALGAVLMAGGLTQAAFQLIGGAISDRVSPKLIMVISDVVRALVVGLLALLIVINAVEVWHLYALAALFGIADAFFFPAYVSAVPMIVAQDQLRASNALLRGTNRLMGFVGPAIAGVVIQAAGEGPAFAVDGATFLVAAAAAWLMTLSRGERAISDATQNDKEGENREGLFKSIAEGIRYTIKEPLVRNLILLVAVIEFAFAGPARIGLAALANGPFKEYGAVALGWMLGALGGGMLIGMFLAGSIDIEKRRGKIVIAVIFLNGVGLGLIGFATHIIWACFVLASIGLGGGLANIILAAWIQSSPERSMLGRVIGLWMFTVTTLEPISFGLAGLLAEWNLQALFVAGGAVMIIAGILSLFNRTLRTSD
jgi:MFS family permease